MIGSAVATVAVIMPSLIIIMLISSLLKSISQFEVVQHALAGIRVGVAALIVVSVAKLFKKGVKNLLGYIVFALSLLAILAFDLSPILLVLAAVVIGVIKALKGGEKA